MPRLPKDANVEVQLICRTLGQGQQRASRSRCVELPCPADASGGPQGHAIISALHLPRTSGVATVAFALATEQLELADPGVLWWRSVFTQLAVEMKMALSN